MDRRVTLPTTRAALGLHVACALILSLAATHAAAQQGTLADQHDPAPPGDRSFGVQSADVRGAQRLRLGAQLDLAHDSLVLRQTQDDERVGAVVSDQLWLRLQGSFALRDRYLFTLELPMAVVQAGDDPSDAASGLSAKSPDQAELGDLRIGARVRLLGPAGEGEALSLGAHLWLPTGASDSYVSDGKVRAMPFVVVGGLRDRLSWSAQLGVMLRPGKQLPGDTATPVGTALSFGGGVGYLVDRDRTLRIGPELYGQSVLAQGGGLFEEKSTNAELLAGARFRPGGGDYEIGLAAGPGIGRGAGTPAYRLLASFGWVPEDYVGPRDRDGDGIADDDDACPDVYGISTGDPTTHGCPDRDGDHVEDGHDACPDTPGVASSDPKKDGCPPDRDSDGVVDTEDACPDVPGEHTADPKTNGCPAPVDWDGDGIGDERDACPQEAGAPSDDPKKNGCPDRDHDGVLDKDDACPDEVGVPQTDVKHDGCPLAALVKEEQRIAITMQIQFDTGTANLRPESEPILQDVLKVMTTHAEVARVEVQGHTDNRGSRQLNTKLSADRAATVMKWLVDHGIAAGRLQAKGYGPDKPIGDNATEAGRFTNRRVEFRIVDGPGTEKGR